MKIIRADVMGACFGVERALKVLTKELDYRQDDPRPLYTYGHLVHNTQIIKKIQEHGVKSLEEPNDKPGILVVRAHGIDKPHYDKFHNAGFTIVDATCPIVKRNYLAMSKETQPILYVGEKHHSETEVYQNSVPVPFFIVDTVEAVAELDASLDYAAYFQTTFKTVLGNDIRRAILERQIKVTYKSDICKASTDRRHAVEKLANNVNVIVVIGDKMSANSNALVALAEKLGCKTFLIENSADVKYFPYKDEEVIGLTAAASVTSAMIDMYEKMLLEL